MGVCCNDCQQDTNEVNGPDDYPEAIIEKGRNLEREYRRIIGDVGITDRTIKVDSFISLGKT